MGRTPSVLLLLAITLTSHIFLLRSSERFAPSTSAQYYSNRRLSTHHAGTSAISARSGNIRRSVIPSNDTLGDLSPGSSNPTATTFDFSFFPPINMFPFPSPPEPEEKGARIALIPVLLLYITFLLAFLGICSGDFLVPNLATISDVFGLSESTAGVTLLALGNGSPDVFSTYSSFKASTASLAIGELVGAATFITSVVVGSMALVSPFQVRKAPFFRDVGFALAAVVCLTVVLEDGKLDWKECCLMVALYVLYVLVVVLAPVIADRFDIGGVRLTGEENERVFQDEPEELDLEGNNPTPDHQSSQKKLRIITTALSQVSSGRSRRLSSVSRHSPPSPTTRLPRASSPDSISLLEVTTPAILHPEQSRPHLPSRIPSQKKANRSIASAGPHPHHHRSQHSADYTSSPMDGMPPRFSLLGAVEFRDIVNNLKKEEGDNTDSDWEAVLNSPFSSGHYHPHHHHHEENHQHDSSSCARTASTPGGRRQLERRASHKSLNVLNQEADAGRSAHQPQSVSSTPTNRFKDSVTSYFPTGPGNDDSPLSVSQGSDATIRQNQQPSSSTEIHTVANALPPDLLRKPRKASMSSRIEQEASPAPPFLLVQAPTSTAQQLHSIIETNSPSLPPPSSTGYKRKKAWKSLRRIYHTLCPSLQSLHHKSVVGKVLAVLAAPAILALTLTLPVVDKRADMLDGCCDNDEVKEWNDEESEAEGRDSVDAPSGKVPATTKTGDPKHHHPNANDVGHRMHERLIDLGENPATAPATPAEGEWSTPSHQTQVSSQEDVLDYETEETEELYSLKYNKWLTATQCVLAPAFISQVFFFHEDSALFYLILFTVPGVFVAVTVIWFNILGSNGTWRFARCCLGFLSAMVWIMTIADCVVATLTVFGELAGLSHAIIGVTIFAIGNSVADLVANLSIAALGLPVMAFSACFGGPMLNILLGIGISGTTMTLSSGKSYPIDFDATLWVSAGGLICILALTLLVVPLNNYTITRTWGLMLIGGYFMTMIVNICVETFYRPNTSF